MRTESDAHLEKAAYHVSEAIRSLTEVVLKRTSGWEEYGQEARQSFATNLALLIDIRSHLPEDEER